MPAALPQITLAKTKELLAQGMNQTETAKVVGISRDKAHDIAKDYKKEIERLALDIISKSIPPIRELHLNTLNLSNKLIKSLDKPPNDDLTLINNNMAAMGLTAKDLIIIADKKEFRALQIMGIAPSHTASVVINNLFAVGTMNVVDPGVQAALGSQLDSILSDDDVTEAEYSDDMSNIEGDN